jgi:hypothetical protein
MATTKTTTARRDVSSEITYLTRALKAPTLRDSAARLAERARAENWSHEEYLVACLQREVSARESHGGEGRIRAARFPARKSLEEFDFDHARGLKRDTIAHLGTLDFVTARDNVVFLGPPGTGKTHLAIGLAMRACQAGHRVMFATAAGCPFGLSIVVPVNMPLPTKIVTQVLQPIDIAAEFGDDPGVAEIDAHVRFVMHSAIDRLARKRGCLSSAGALAAPKPPNRVSEIVG